MCRIAAEEGLGLDVVSEGDELLGGTLNRDREALIQTIDAALDGKVRLRRAVELGL